MPTPPSDRRPLDPRVWRACAGSSVQIPALHSRVYYFPQGHIQHSCHSTPVLSPLAYSKPLIPCIVSAVHFLADSVTDEVFARFVLLPVLEPSRAPNQFVQKSANTCDDNGDNRRIVSFAKILTPSDANNGGGFSVPRFCADSIFPPLDYQADPPVQTLSASDVHGTVFEFRHIYRGTPRRHLLTTGWSKFVNNKKLIAGDSVVFMRDSTNGQMFIGVRRSVKIGTGGDDARWREPISGEGIGVEGSVEGFSKGGRRRVTSEAVVESVERAAMGLPFQVVYYPRAGWTDFIVRAEAAETALSISWVGGMRVKMAVETEDSSRLSWFQGTVDSAAPEHGCWGASPWRMLQVTWDEPEVLQNAKRVSPWQVEFLGPSPLHTANPPAKKLKFPENSGLTDGEGDIIFPMSGLTNSTVGQINSSPLNYYFPAGVQGARQDHSSLLSLSNFVSESNPIKCNNNLFRNCMVPKLKRVSTELNIGSTQSDDLSPDGLSSVHSFGSELVENKGCNSTKVGISSLQLFGKIIYMKEPIDSGSDDVGSPESNETEVVHNELDLPSEFC